MADENREQAIKNLWDQFIDEQPPLTDSYTEFQRAASLGYAAGLAEGIPQADGWVDVADRLPEHESKYLVTTEVVGDRFIRNVYMIDFFEERWLGLRDYVRVIAWQPLPAPYQRQSSEGE